MIERYLYVEKDVMNLILVGIRILKRSIKTRAIHNMLRPNCIRTRSRWIYSIQSLIYVTEYIRHITHKDVFVATC